MLNLIHSPFIIKKILNYLYDKKKLKMIKYNKEIQRKINISLMNYRILSERYIIYETNIFGKEYNYDGKLLFSGEYKNGERNGKGKEYHSNGKLKFEGEYRHGVRNGKGAEYDEEEKLIFEGMFLNGISSGKGKEYDINYQLIFDGEFSNGKRWKGKEKVFDDEFKL